jgi:hypothetical protein
MRERSLLLAFLLCCQASPSFAAEPYGPTEEEKKSLPPYCGGPGGGDWKAILGPEIGANNHTCYGINRINRYFRTTRAWEKRDHLTTALIDFNYSVGHLSPQFKLMPEILYYRGIVYKLQGRNPDAMADFIKSISLEPKYTRSVIELADIYDNKLSDRKKALEVVTEGLRHSPEAKDLQRRYEKLGGKLPYPEPYAKPAASPTTAEPAKTPEANSTAAPTTAAKPDVAAAPAQAPAAPKVDAPASVAKPDQPAARSPQPAPGSPSNPWCRFCPDAGQTQGPAPSSPPAEPKAAP